MQLAESKGIKNATSLAKFMGYNGSEKLYRLNRADHAKPSYEMLEDFSNKFENLNLRWLITGKGEMLENHVVTPVFNNHFSEPEVEYAANTPVDNSDVKTQISKKHVSPTVSPTVKRVPQMISVNNEKDENILYVGQKAAAGYLNGYGDKEYMETLPAFNLPGLADGTYRAFQIRGNSMSPTLEDKDMIIGRWLENLDHIREDRVHVIVTKNDGVVAKRLLNRIDKYGFVVAKSDALSNRNEYPNLEIYPDDILEIWYGVFHGSFSFKAPSEIYHRVNDIEADITEMMRVLRHHNIMPGTIKGL